MSDLIKHLDNHFKAKSKDEKNYQITLTEHTLDVLTKLADQFRLRESLVEAYSEETWNILYWACFLHDFGKAAHGFQEVLILPRGERNVWSSKHHRHEVLSLGFVNWLFPQGHLARPWIIGAIASHHKDSQDVFTLYGGKKPLSKEPEEIAASYEANIQDLADNLDETAKELLWSWLYEYTTVWAEELGFILTLRPQLIPLTEALQQDLARNIYKALREYADWQNRLNGDDSIQAVIQRGLILTADHSASAGAPPFPDLDFDRQRAHKPFDKIKKDLKAQGTIFTFRQHQEQAETAEFRSAIMVAPTGSGKTEAAFLWTARQMEHQPACRIFYTLPYQASMNAMADRIAQRYYGFSGLIDKGEDGENKNDQVTILHSRARLKFYQEMMEWEENARAATDTAKRLQNQARLNYYPIQVFSPYQMLKAGFALKGYETLLVDYTNALFIFDEIHAYDPKRMALIIEMIRWLRENFHARFLVMTATLPPMVREKLAEALDNPQEIVASVGDFADSQRHRVQMLDGDLLENIVDKIEPYITQNQTVLVCCNRVATAQHVYNALQAIYGFTYMQDILLLHGRFNGQDRNKIERRLLEVVPTGEKTHLGSFVIVATQAVEVSLDIDLDTLFTEPAPLEALLQRFGRVNRGRQDKKLLPVHVFQEPSNPLESAGDLYKPYEEAIVRRSIEVLQDWDNQPIDESIVSDLLAEIYQGEILDQWRKDYDEIATSFPSAYLHQIRPYQSASQDKVISFYELFEGMSVLPEDCRTAYDKAKKRSFLAANQYMVSLSLKKWQIGQFINKRILWQEDDLWCTSLSYHEETGLALEEAYD